MQTDRLPLIRKRDNPEHFYLIALLILCAAVLFYGLGRLPFIGPDEPRYGAIAEEMRSFVHGVCGLVLLHENGIPYTQKPPLFFWLAAAFGFTIDERWEDKGTLLGVMMRAGRTEIGLNQDDWKKGRDRTKGIGVRLSISTPGSVDEIAKRAKNAGITLTSEPRDTEWKSRAFEVSDPSGFLLTIFSETSA